MPGQLDPLLLAHRVPQRRAVEREPLRLHEPGARRRAARPSRCRPRGRRTAWPRTSAAAGGGSRVGGERHAEPPESTVTVTSSNTYLATVAHMTPRSRASPHAPRPRTAARDDGDDGRAPAGRPPRGPARRARRGRRRRDRPARPDGRHRGHRRVRPGSASRCSTATSPTRPTCTPPSAPGAPTLVLERLAPGPASRTARCASGSTWRCDGLPRADSRSTPTSSCCWSQHRSAATRDPLADGKAVIAAAIARVMGDALRDARRRRRRRRAVGARPRRARALHRRVVADPAHDEPRRGVGYLSVVRVARLRASPASYGVRLDAPTASCGWSPRRDGSAGMTRHAHARPEGYDGPARLVTEEQSRRRRGAAARALPAARRPLPLVRPGPAGADVDALVASARRAAVRTPHGDAAGPAVRPGPVGPLPGDRHRPAAVPGAVRYRSV